jgi:hypothetical protein
MHKYVCEMQVDNCPSAHLFGVEGRLQGHTDGAAEVSDADHDERQPLSFREVPHRHCCRFVCSTVAL